MRVGCHLFRSASDHGSDERAYFLGLGGRRSPAGADGPHGFISDHYAA
jgi:hypothetical protein